LPLNGGAPALYTARGVRIRRLPAPHSASAAATAAAAEGEEPTFKVSVFQAADDALSLRLEEEGVDAPCAFEARASFSDWVQLLFGPLADLDVDSVAEAGTEAEAGTGTEANGEVDADGEVDGPPGEPRPELRSLCEALIECLAFVAPAAAVDPRDLSRDCGSLASEREAASKREAEAVLRIDEERLAAAGVTSLLSLRATTSGEQPHAALAAPAGEGRVAAGGASVEGGSAAAAERLQVDVKVRAPLVSRLRAAGLAGPALPAGLAEPLGPGGASVDALECPEAAGGAARGAPPGGGDDDLWAIATSESTGEVYYTRVPSSVWWGWVRGDDDTPAGADEPPLGDALRTSGGGAAVGEAVGKEAKAILVERLCASLRLISYDSPPGTPVDIDAIQAADTTEASAEAEGDTTEAAIAGVIAAIAEAAPTAEAGDIAGVATAIARAASADADTEGDAMASIIAGVAAAIARVASAESNAEPDATAFAEAAEVASEARDETSEGRAGSKAKGRRKCSTERVGTAALSQAGDERSSSIPRRRGHHASTGALVDALAGPAAAPLQDFPPVGAAVSSESAAVDGAATAVDMVLEETAAAADSALEGAASDSLARLASREARNRMALARLAKKSYLK